MIAPSPRPSSNRSSAGSGSSSRRSPSSRAARHNSPRIATTTSSRSYSCSSLASTTNWNGTDRLDQPALRCGCLCASSHPVSVAQCPDDEVDGHLKTHGRCVGQVVFGPFPAVTDVLIVAHDHHQAALIIEDPEVRVVVRIQPWRLAGLDLRGYRGQRIDVVVDAPDRMVVWKLLGLAIRKDALQDAVEILPLPSEGPASGIMKIIDDDEPSAVQLGAQILDFLPGGIPVSGLAQV